MKNGKFINKSPSLMLQDHLGLLSPVTIQDLKSAYRRKVKELHPNINPHGTELFKEFQKADRLVNGEDKPTKENLRAVAAALYTAQMNLDQNLPYVMEEMEEGIEKRMSTAVSEFESYVAFSLQAKGLEHLAAQAPRLNSPEQKSLPDGSLESE